MSPQAIAIALLTRANAYERGDLTDTSPKLLRDASGAISSLLLRLAEARAQRDALAEALRKIASCEQRADGDVVSVARIALTLTLLETEK